MKTQMPKLMKFLLVGVGAAALLSGISCSPANTDLVVAGSKAPPPPPLPELPVYNFEFARSSVSFQQATYDKNLITTHFQVNKDDQSVNDIKKEDLVIRENGKPVTNFSLGADAEELDQVADIVFVVDITGTMTQFIESAKTRLQEFIRTSRRMGFHTRMCISTFGDWTVKKCDRFFDNNPKDRSTEAQVTELLSELAQLHAFRGQGRDPGWPDLDENSMRALIDASKAPWAEKSQRFVILVTDYTFLYSPNNQGTVGALAPDMAEVTDAINSSQIKVFAVTPNRPGYNSPFQDKPGIVQSSGGEFFEFSRVLRGEVSLNHVLDRILRRIKTSYTVTYTVEDNPGLDPSLTQDTRSVEISLRQQNRGVVTLGSVVSSLPTGRPVYQKNWMLSEHAVRESSAAVTVNGNDVNPSEYTIRGQKIQFESVPPAGAKLRINFLHEAAEKNFRLSPMNYPGVLNAENVDVYLNDVRARNEDIVFAQDMEGNTSLQLAPAVMHVSDPYKIFEKNGLRVRVVRKGPGSLAARGP